jgi:hypothetical protein
VFSLLSLFLLILFFLSHSSSSSSFSQTVGRQLRCLG